MHYKFRAREQTVKAAGLIVLSRGSKHVLVI